MHIVCDFIKRRNHEGQQLFTCKFGYYDIFFDNIHLRLPERLRRFPSPKACVLVDSAPPPFSVMSPAVSFGHSQYEQAPLRDLTTPKT